MEASEKSSIASTDQQQLAWSQEIPHYGDKLLKRLEEFRKTTILYDVRIYADGGEFNAHKVILAACGGMFRTCFIDEKNKMISSTITELKLDCPSQGLKPIIKFAYTGSLIVTKRNAVATMIAAEVTNMREVQEICADIAIKEYGWIITFVGDKNPTVVESVQKVLCLHAPCLKGVAENTPQADTSDKQENLPFMEEVTDGFPDYMTTYQKLAACLNRAQALLTSSKSKLVNVELDGPRSNSDTSGLAKVLDSAEPPANDSSKDIVSNETPIIMKSVESLTVENSNGKTFQPPSSPNLAEKAIKMNGVSASPPSRKPRSSIKSKAAPPPPSPQLLENTQKSPIIQRPPRPQKQPTKLPPPRPKPPAKKKLSGDEETSSKNNTEVEYDNTLNPFA